MIRDVILPQLAMGMSEGTIVEWAVAEGSNVKRDQNIVSIETEKVVTDLPAPYGGFLHIIARTGVTLSIETLIAKIADTEAEYQALVAGGAQAASAIPANAASPAVAPASVADTPTAATAQAETARPHGRIRASGLAKSFARKHSLDLTGLVGSGPGGRIVRRDVTAALEAVSRPVQTSLLPHVSGDGKLRERTRIPLSGMRGAIAQKMLAAKTTAAQTYAFFEVDITKLLAARRSMLDIEDELGQRVSLMSFYAKAISLACQHVPICNSTLVDGQVIVWENTNIGIAVALPGRTEFESGLIVPVVRNVQLKGLAQISLEIRDLVGRARKGELRPDETTEGTITISSTDGFLPGGWMVSTPLLNVPQVMNVQPGSPIEKPVVRDGQVAIRTMLPCGVTFDHRAMDGAPLGKFVTKLRDLLTNPELMLL